MKLTHLVRLQNVCVIMIIMALLLTACTPNQGKDQSKDQVPNNEKSQKQNENQGENQSQDQSQDKGDAQSGGQREGESQSKSQDQGNDQQKDGQSSASQPNGMLHGLALKPNEVMGKSEDAILPITSINQVSYIKAKDLAHTLEYQMQWDEANRKLQLGETDVSYELFMDTRKAFRHGEEIQIEQPFASKDNELYIPVNALRDLFQEDMFFDITEQEVRIHANPGLTITNEDDPGNEQLNGDADFADDPSDPSRESTDTEVSTQFTSSAPTDQDFSDAATPVLKKINIDRLIREARKYEGVKYQFGADSYELSKRFDCSTYTQHVYRKSGVTLPRMAREQANRGKVVSRKSLRKGDLLFFYVPGRFKSNKVVGHVGIYMGGNNMIHSVNRPKDGVQITNINKPYWKNSFMFGKRVAQ